MIPVFVQIRNCKQPDLLIFDVVDYRCFVIFDGLLKFVLVVKIAAGELPLTQNLFSILLLLWPGKRMEND